MKFREHLEPKPKTFFFHHHQKKAKRLEQTLMSFGWREVRGNASVAFFDLDILNRVDMFNAFHKRGVKLFLYPHAARPQIVYGWQGCVPHPHTTAHFVFAPGHEEVMRVIGYPHPIHVMGWTYTDVLPFKPVEQVRSAVFAPLHPNSNGWLSEEDRAVNYRAFDNLRAAAKKMGFKITVRFLQTLENNGLTMVEDPDITYMQGKPDNSIEQILSHDLVVGTQTYAFMAVALGKPTLMMDEWIAPRAGNSDEVFQYIRDWDKFKHLMMFPHDINATSDVPGLIEHVTRSDADILDWKARMIGDPFNPKAFHQTVLGYLDTAP